MITEINKLIPDDYINILINKFNLENYKYIDNINDFSLLSLRGSLKYINKYTHQLRYGGLLIKIFQKDNKWYGMIKKVNNKIYYVSFDSNYIFYLEYKSKKDKFRNILELFMNDVNKDKYIIN